MKNSITVVIVALTLVACSSQTNQTTSTAKSVTTTVTHDECSTINSLISGYQTAFHVIKTDKIAHPFTHQWHTQTQLMGSNCTVTVNQLEQTSYQCNVHLETQSEAVKSHHQLAQQLRQCLTPQGWFESQKETSDTIFSSFVLDAKTPAITLFTAQETNGFSTRFEIAPALGR
ncbi:hypothetical protein [Pseudoalteromonas sp.]|uniref:hypothetical protein n=1 Tax=Pseudoalteromonas sp. TaxID=53249 RepID=UPI003568F678